MNTNKYIEYRTNKEDLNLRLCAYKKYTNVTYTIGNTRIRKTFPEYEKAIQFTSNLFTDKNTAKKILAKLQKLEKEISKLEG